MSDGSRIEDVDGKSWEFHPMDPPPVANRVRAVVRARVMDEITRSPITSKLSLKTSRKDLVPRVASDGLVGLVGQPAYSLPSLATSAITLDMRVTCPGYVPLTLRGPLGPIPGFPNAFSALDFTDVLLHRTGITIEGRVVQRTTLAPPPLPGATVAIDAVWSTLPPANWTPPALAEPPRIVALSPGLYLARAPATQIRERPLTPTGPTSMLAASVEAGSTKVRLSARDALAVGDVLLLDQFVAGRQEAIPITAVEPTLAPDLPTWITLAHPCAWAHRRNAACVAVSVGVATASAATSRAGHAGDCVAFLSAAPAFVNGAFVEIDDGINPREYQRTGIYQTVADASGYFRMPPISRVALVRLLVQSPGLTSARPIVTLDYPRPTQFVTVSLE